MTDDATPPAGPAPRDPEKPLRDIAIAVYALQAAFFFVGISPLVGVILNYVKLEDVAGTWLESHYRWQIRTFWWALAWSVVGFVTLIVLVGFAVLAAAAIWYIYRIAKGWTRLAERRPVA